MTEGGKNVKCEENPKYKYARRRGGHSGAKSDACGGTNRRNACTAISDRRFRGKEIVQRNIARPSCSAGFR
jgi:hypothetical protein